MPDPTTLTVQLTPRSVDALLRAARTEGLSRTDTVNRAIQFYDFVVDMLAQDGDSSLLVTRNGRTEQIDIR